jgi:hypothetical protein
MKNVTDNLGGGQIYSTLVVFTNVTHSSPSLTASLAILVPKRSQFSEISTSKKSEHDTARVLSRPHSPVSQILYWSQTESSKWSLDCLSSQAGQPRSLFLSSYSC